MKNRRLVVLGSIVVIGTLSSCGTGTVAQPTAQPTAPTASVLTTKTPSPTITSLPSPTPGVTPDMATKLKDSTYITPGKVEIGNLFPGGKGEYPLTVHNGKDENTTFLLKVSEPNNLIEGYQAFPKEYYDWITISNPMPGLGPKESKDVLITVAMPSNVNFAGKKVEFWVVVSDQGQSGMVQTQLASTWLITTAN